jgi:hypothetical protein
MEGGGWACFSTERTPWECKSDLLGPVVCTGSIKIGLEIRMLMIGDWYVSSSGQDLEMQLGHCVLQSLEGQSQRGAAGVS